MMLCSPTTFCFVHHELTSDKSNSKKLDFINIEKEVEILLDLIMQFPVYRQTIIHHEFMAV